MIIKVKDVCFGVGVTIFVTMLSSKHESLYFIPADDLRTETPNKERVGINSMHATGSVNGTTTSFSLKNWTIIHNIDYSQFRAW